MKKEKERNEKKGRKKKGKEEKKEQNKFPTLARQSYLLAYLRNSHCSFLRHSRCSFFVTPAKAGVSSTQRS